jgi:uncharacterized membrane protein YuzA (DUF378 family)
LTHQLLFYLAAASTFIAGILHLAIIPMFFKMMPMNVTLFFLISGLAQVFWVIPVLKRWSNLWFYVGVAGTVILIIMWVVAVPGSGHPVDANQAVIEGLQIIFIVTSIVILKNRASLKVNNQNV